MSNMLNEEGYTFKELEKEIFRMVCEWGQVFTRTFLQEYDTYLMNSRDKEAYRNKGFRTTTIKTVYGEVTYQRRIGYLSKTQTRDIIVPLMSKVVSYHAERSMTLWHIHLL